ncbi:unnamed protein product [Ceutorhynchus assimilis]|uniref:Uncharacterized protein n=1 Tax=Ceutorhynchus assimilis TaxID=467358 RepID=A0A9N9MG64_9CUCU|nr:unnamed protein product [Ceutorhynchus assimilis]
MFDQHFKQVGDCIGKEDCPGVSDKGSAHYLLSWGISWGGSLGDNGYHWRMGNSVCYYGYQNLVAAHGLLNEASMRPRGATAIEDWQHSLERQLELYEYLQTSQGAFAAGVTNSYNKNYDDPPQEYKDHSFYGMWFDYQPGYADANPWFGFQPWTADRVAQYYYITGNERAKNITSKWVSWVISEIHFNENGDFTIPTNLKWEGLPPNTVVTITGRGTGANSASCTARTLAYYAARSGDTQAREVSKKLLDALWSFHQTDKGYANVETFTQYSNFNNPLFLPLANWSGIYPNGDVINSNSTFLSVRSWFKKDPNWEKVQKYLDGGEAPSFPVHRFWENADLAISLAVYDMLFNK